METINDMLKKMVELGGSDLHLKVGGPPIARIDGDLKQLSRDRLSADAINQMVFGILNEKQKRISQRIKSWTSPTACPASQDSGPTCACSAARRGSPCA